MQKLLLVSLILFGACAESPAVDGLDPLPGTDGKSDTSLAIPSGSYRGSSHVDGQIAALLIDPAMPGEYRRIIVGDPAQQAGSYLLTSNEWGQPRIQFEDAWGDVFDERDYHVSGRTLQLIGPAGTETLTRVDAASCPSAGGTCVASDVTPGVAPTCEELGRGQALGWCDDVSESCCTPAAEPVDCQTTGCDAGNSCEDCIGGYVCLPDGVSC